MRPKVEHRIFPGMKYSALRARKLALASLALTGALFTTGCAGLFARDITTVSVLKSERLYLRVAPFDSVVTAELTRAGVDPQRLASELEEEVRYRLYLRGQEEAQDSVSATVVVTFTVNHLQPGSANTGTFASYVLKGYRPKGARTETSEWTVQGRSKDNVPGTFTARHLARQAAEDVLKRLQPPRDNEPPPPLHLMR
jgi:hypothetical protein